MPRRTKTSKIGQSVGTKQFLIEQHYLSMGDELDWTVNRLNRLCAAIQLTPVELGAYLRLPPHQMKRYVAANRFPATVELHLCMIERAAFYSSKPPVFPAL